MNTKLIKKGIYFRVIFVALSVFILSFSWEFFLQEFFAGNFGNQISETASEKWHFVITSLIFVTIALIYPLWNALKSADRRKIIENKVDDQQKFLHTIIDSLNHPFCVIDVNNYNVLISNRKLDYSSQYSDKCYYIAHQLKAPCKLKNHVCPIKAIKKSNQPAHLEHIHYDEDGNPVFVELRAYPIFDKKGALIQIIEYSFDITERKKAEKERERLFAILDSATDFISMADPRGNTLYLNPAGKKILGYSEKKSIKNMRVIDQLPKSQQKNVLNHAFPTAARTGFWKGEISLLHKNGREIPALAALQSHKSPQGEVESYSVIIRDITELKKTEKTLRNSKEETEKVNRQLKKSMEQAKQLAITADSANRSKSEFLANMSHEIRTPMNGVIGMTGLLLETELNKAQSDYAETIKSSADSLLTIINDILDYSKIEAGKLDFEILDFDLRLTLEDMIDSLAHQAFAKNLELSCLIDPDVPSLLCGDPGRLRQILTNLISNAIKFTAKGEVALFVRLEKKKKRNTLLLRFSVKDTGIGIPSDKIENLFNVFTQADGSTTREYGGTGLGLSISKQLAELMGGQIGAESQVGKGSTFWITSLFEKQAQKLPEDKPYPDGILESLKEMYILIVDDSANNRLVLSSMLASWGCRYDEADGAGQALTKLRAAAKTGKPFKFAILDMIMPKTDGETLGKLIKKDPKIHDTRLVLLTTIGKRGDSARMEKAGFSAYLPKPVRQSQLFDCLITIIGRKMEINKMPEQILTRHRVTEQRKQNFRILLAEDNMINQKVALKILDNLGYFADAVANGLEAVHALETTPYNLVLMDVQMPEMSGLEATRVIRDLKSKVKNHNITIIALTAHAMKGDREECINAGMDDYLSKPINPKELGERLNHWLPLSTRTEDEESGTIKIIKTKVFDQQALIERIDGDEELLETILEMFVENIPERLNSIKDAIDNKDFTIVKREAHSLKGAAATISADRITELAQQLEELKINGNISQVKSILALLYLEFEQLQKTLEQRAQVETV